MDFSRPQGSAGSLGSAQWESSEAADKHWCLSLVYIAIGLAVAVTTTNGLVGPAEKLGQDAYNSLLAIPNNDKPRNWYDEAKAEAFEHLKREVAKIEEAYPGTIEFAHQEVPLEKTSNPLVAEDCLSLGTEECIREWPHFTNSLQCAVQCPFDNSTLEGRRCCGELGLDLERPLVPFGRPLRSNGTMQNVIFAVKGFNSSIDGAQEPDEDEVGQALLASAHYDSNSGAPGIGDDLAGTAVLLEVARTLASRESPLRRDVIFAFLDGEEMGLLGASLFRAGHPWRRRPAAVVNLEGKGKANRKAYMLRANSPYMAQAYAQQVRRPAGNSISEFIWATLNPGSTDLDVYRRLGYHMMDILFIQDAFVYHTVDDNIEKSASPEGMQHEAGTVLSILEFIANDSFFPELLDSSADPLIGAWNNQYPSDPGFTSGYVYFAILDVWMVAMPILAARILFVTVALAVPVITLPAVWDRISVTFAEFGLCVLWVFLGVFSGYMHSRLILVHRDLRTWYDWQFFRFAFLGIGAVLPVMLFQTLRKYWGLLSAGDHTTFLVGSIWTYCLFLLLLGVLLPHLGCFLLWFPLFAAVALGSETTFASKDRETELVAFRRQAMATEEEEAAADRDPGEVDSSTKALPFSALMRDLVAVAAPTMLTLPMSYNLANTLSYILDGIGFSVYNGVLVGFFAIFVALPLFSVRQRLAAQRMEVCLLVEITVYMLLLCAVLLIHGDESAACHFNRVYCGVWR